jgi:5-(carboxyamino)imidazole ribonucleotide mutase
MTQCQVGVVMGSNSDWDTMQHAAQILQEFGVTFETRVVSAHRMPDDMFAYAEAAQERGLRAIIAGAGGAAHLPGMIAAKTIVPVLGVPVASKHLQGVDSLHSIVQMPKGIPVATFAIGNAGLPMRLCLQWPCSHRPMRPWLKSCKRSAWRKPKWRAT